MYLTLIDVAYHRTKVSFTLEQKTWLILTHVNPCVKNEKKSYMYNVHCTVPVRTRNRSFPIRCRVIKTRAANSLKKHFEFAPNRLAAAYSTSAVACSAMVYSPLCNTWRSDLPLLHSTLLVKTGSKLFV